MGMRGTRLRAVLGTVAVVAAAMVWDAPSARGSVIGTVNLTGSMTMTQAKVDFVPPVGGSGAVTTGEGTALTYTGGTMGSGVAGTIKDLAPTDFAMTNWATFTGSAAAFDLTQLGPGLFGAVAFGLPPAPGQTGSPATGLTFLNMLNTPDGVVISFDIGGLAHDGTGAPNPWKGVVTAQVAGGTLQQVGATLATGGSVTTTFSASITAVPEPVGLGMVGGAALLLGARRRRQRN